MADNYELYVDVVGGDTYYFRGEKATRVFRVINDAGAQGAKWATVVTDDSETIFILANITRIVYRKEREQFIDEITPF